MKRKTKWILLALTLSSLGILLNAHGRPTPVVAPQPVEPKQFSITAGAAQVRPDPGLVHPELLTKPAETNVVKVSTEPQLIWGTNAVITGLIVDGFKPQQTWRMLNPPAPDVTNPLPQVLIPVAAPLPGNQDLAVHESDFALLRFHFPSAAKVAKVQP